MGSTLCGSLLRDCPKTTLAIVVRVGQAFQPAVMALMQNLWVAGWKACPTFKLPTRSSF
jgi:hypothetical protein